ncbi:hypothetical protein RIF29_28538 [Crotalaria pallida]|uniref:Uncharacterized protein n=1 Tax=Crotalaria pallida TaxID=3830 RepID=A0AAN9EI47_CROPI
MHFIASCRTGKVVTKANKQQLGKLSLRKIRVRCSIPLLFLNFKSPGKQNTISETIKEMQKKHFILF